jgi:hypothetical protein
MSRLNIELQNELEPKRIEFAKEQITKLGYQVIFESKREIRFMFKDSVVHFWPYSGWHSGASIKDGRGIKKLLEQIK